MLGVAKSSAFVKSHCELEADQEGKACGIYASLVGMVLMQIARSSTQLHFNIDWVL